MRGFLKAMAGLAVPLVAFGALLYYLAPGPSPQPPPPDLTVASAPAGGDDPARATPDGDWVLDRNGSFVGYRIAERNPARFTDHEVVGRTDAVEGTLHVDGDVVTAAEVVADARELTSDRSSRDDAIRRRYLESDRYPDASFRLTEPVHLAPGPVPNEVIERTAAGQLTLHGVTRDVEADVEALWTGSAVQVAGVVPVDLAHYDITPPRIVGFRMVRDHGDVEFRLKFVRPRPDGAPATLKR